MSELSNMLRGILQAGVVSAMILSVAGCGVKSSPAPSAEEIYPRQYPASGPKPAIGTAPARTDQSGEDKGAGVPRSSLGFPLEYPNRATYK
jgi:hypothetical protein